jgi:hypothetical protein
VVGDEPLVDVVSAFLEEKSAGGIGAPCDVCCVFIPSATAWADVTSRWAEAGEISVASIEIGDVAGVYNNFDQD